MNNFISTLLKILLVSLLLFLSTPLLSFANDNQLIMGIFPRRNATTTTKFFTPLADYLTKKLARKVILETTKDFPSFWKKVQDKYYDIVHYNQYHYVKSHHEYGYQVIALNEEFGKIGIRGVIAVRKDSGYSNIKDLKNKKIIFGAGKKAMISYIVPTYLLRQNNLKAGDYTETYAKNPPNAALAVFYKQAAAGGMGDTVIDMPLLQKQIKMDELKIIAQSEPLTHLPWAVKGDMDKELQNNIQKLLSNLKKSPEGIKILATAKLTGLHIATDKDFNEHRKIIKEVFGEI